MSPRILTMTTKFEPIRCCVRPSSLGPAVIASSEKGICAIMFGEDVAALTTTLANKFPGANLITEDIAFDPLADQVVQFIDQAKGTVDFPLDLRGTDFQQRVWQVLIGIKPGRTASYKDVAKWIGVPKAVRAIARACAANPVAVAVPCHRVIRNDGSLSGYRWGTARKRALLDREARSRTNQVPSHSSRHHGSAQNQSLVGQPTIHTQ